MQGEGHLLLGETFKFCDRTMGVNPKTYNVEYTPLPEGKTLSAIYIPFPGDVPIRED